MLCSFLLLIYIVSIVGLLTSKLVPTGCCKTGTEPKLTPTGCCKSGTEPKLVPTGCCKTGSEPKLVPTGCCKNWNGTKTGSNWLLQNRNRLGLMRKNLPIKPTYLDSSQKKRTSKQWVLNPKTGETDQGPRTVLTQDTWPNQPRETNNGPYPRDDGPTTDSTSCS